MLCLENVKISILSEMFEYQSWQGGYTKYLVQSWHKGLGVLLKNLSWHKVYWPSIKWQKTLYYAYN